jgi:hypothetical protein
MYLNTCFIWIHCTRLFNDNFVMSILQILQLVKEHLTSSNLPSCQCAICLYGFREGDHFTKTQCYHYFHSHCLACHVTSSEKSYQEELDKLPAWQRSQHTLSPCQVCILLTTWWLNFIYWPLLTWRWQLVMNVNRKVSYWDWSSAEWFKNHTVCNKVIECDSVQQLALLITWLFTVSDSIVSQHDCSAALFTVSTACHFVSHSVCSLLNINLFRVMSTCFREVFRRHVSVIPSHIRLQTFF